MAREQEEAVAQTETASRRYATTVVVLATLGMLGCEFDSGIRHVALPLIIKSLHMNIAQGSMVFSASFLVTFFGNLAIGPILDRWGRKPALIVSLAFSAVFSGLTALVTQAWEYAIIGALAGTSLVVMQPAEVIVSEEVPSKWRGTLMAVVQAGFSVGAIIVSLAGAAILPTGHWRILFLLSFWPLLIAGACLLFLREPPRSAEAIAVKRAARRQASEVRTHYAIDRRRATQSEWAQLFAPDLRRQTVVTAIYGFFGNFGNGFVLVLGVTYLTIYNHLPIGVASGSFAIEGLAALVGQLVSGVVSDRVGPRTVLLIGSLAGGLAIWLLTHRGGVAWVMMALAVYGFVGGGALGSALRYFAESFPTRARGSGVGLVSALQMLGGGTLAPVIYGELMNSGHPAMAAWIAGAVMIAGALALILGRTIAPRKELEELVT
ncbi:MAG: MFS transporter [Firmicutes bacterium]|nr:MFS transporter [Alicyclobacillaceae bacterium]MCL6497742.1 MFS transporter [Bacillota bacterium]